MKTTEKKAKKELEGLKRTIENPVNAHQRRYIIKLMKKAGYSQEMIDAQKKFWDKNKKKPFVKGE